MFALVEQSVISHVNLVHASCAECYFTC